MGKGINNINVWLPKKLNRDLIQSLNIYNESLNSNELKLSKAKASYLVNLPIYLRSRNKDNEYNGGWMPICSDILKNIKNYSKYLNYLIENEFLEKHCSNYSTGNHKCNRYRIHSKYSKHLLVHYKEDVHGNFIRSINKAKRQRRLSAVESCCHLTKWLIPEKFSLDYFSAEEYIKSEYSANSDINKRNFRLIYIDEIQENLWTYSRCGKDNRLHSNLTRLPKDLRKFLTYNGENLFSVDVSNSQPFILSIIIKGIRDNIDNEDIDIIESNNKYRDIVIKYTPIMSDHFDNKLICIEIERFFSLMSDGSFYNVFADYLYEDNVISFFKDGTVSYNSGNNVKKYINKREASKNIFLKALYSSKNSHENIIKTFKNHFPHIFEMIQIFKTDNKSEFPIMIQNVEADCILDFCTKKLSVKYPYMPLFTIHDSIITTELYSDVLKEEFEKLTKIYFGTKPNLKSEHWCEECNNVA